MYGVSRVRRFLAGLLAGPQGARRLVVALAMFGVVTLTAHELQHYVHAEAPDLCAFAYVANSVPPVPPAIVVPPPSYPQLVAWALPTSDTLSPRTETPSSARGPPALVRA